MEVCKNEMYEKYYKLAYFIANKWVKKGVEYNEAMSAAHLALVKCINSKKFDSSKAKFSTYLTNAVDNEVRMHLRREKKHALNVSLSEEFINNNDDGSLGTLEDIIPDKKFEDEMLNKELLIEALYIFDKHKKKLSDRNLRIFNLWLNGFTQKEIAERVDLTQSYVCRVINTIINKLRSELSEL